MGTESKYFLKRIWKWPPISTGEKKKCNVKPMRWLFLTCALQRTTFGKLDCLTVPAQAQQVCRNFLHMFLYLFTLEKKKMMNYTVVITTFILSPRLIASGKTNLQPLSLHFISFHSIQPPSASKGKMPEEWQQMQIFLWPGLNLQRIRQIAI